MSDDATGRDGEWSVLLTRCHEEVEVDQDFKANLLGLMKAKLAERWKGAETDDGLARYEGSWSELLHKTGAHCGPGAIYSHNLLMKLKTRQRELAAGRGDAAFGDVLSASYVPVEPRQEFATRLLRNLKERQRTRVLYLRNLRRRSLFSAFISSAAVVPLVVWIASVNDIAPPDARGATDSTGVANVIVDGGHPIAVEPVIQPAVKSAPGGFSLLAAAYSAPPLPKTARGIGMEMDDGAGWRRLDEDALVRVSPGMAFRSVRPEAAGLGFDDGSVVQMRQDAVIMATEKGFEVRRGTMSVGVPQESAGGFRLFFPERDIAVQPGTLLIVKAFAPDKYADGGAPAPEVMVVDGGFALARGESGVGPLFANRVYMIDNYLTPDIPSRQLCSSELQDLGECGVTAPAPLSPSEPSSSFLRVSGGSPPAESVPGPRGFRRENDMWIADAYDGGDTVKVPYLSDAYFSLADQRRDLASAFVLGPNVIVDGGDGVFYEIHR